MSDDAWLTLADPDSLTIERPLAGTDWQRQPFVEIVGDDLAFWWARIDVVDKGYRATLDAEPTTTAPGLLSPFARLEAATEDRVLAFARRWGALGICAHNLPRAHPPMTSAPRSTYLCEELRRPPGGAPIGHLESMAAWRNVARRVGTILDLAVGLWQEPPVLGDRERWRAINLDAPSDLASGRVALSVAVNRLVQLGQVRVWSAPTPPYVRVGGHDVFGAIASQVLLVTARSEGWSTCSYCARPYAPSRRPQTGRLNYCGACRAAGIPNRVAARNYRTSRRRESG